MSLNISVQASDRVLEITAKGGCSLDELASEAFLRGGDMKNGYEDVFETKKGFDDLLFFAKLDEVNFCLNVSVDILPSHSISSFDNTDDFLDALLSPQA